MLALRQLNPIDYHNATARLYQPLREWLAVRILLASVYTDESSNGGADLPLELLVVSRFLRSNELPIIFDLDEVQPFLFISLVETNEVYRLGAGRLFDPILVGWMIVPLDDVLP
jgi:hypothetical protein